ncbi:hypothetical protein KY285_026272 [Solanum tuberosum]|nr:hypothetical protein KY285_026272 [Solanum tuberosum]
MGFRTNPGHPAEDLEVKPFAMSYDVAVTRLGIVVVKGWDLIFVFTCGLPHLQTDGLVFARGRLQS